MLLAKSTLFLLATAFSQLPSTAPIKKPVCSFSFVLLLFHLSLQSPVIVLSTHTSQNQYQTSILITTTKPKHPKKPITIRPVSISSLYEQLKTWIITPAETIRTNMMLVPQGMALLRRNMMMIHRNMKLRHPGSVILCHGTMILLRGTMPAPVMMQDQGMMPAPNMIRIGRTTPVPGTMQDQGMTLLHKDIILPPTVAKVRGMMLLHDGMIPVRSTMPALDMLRGKRLGITLQMRK